MSQHPANMYTIYYYLCHNELVLIYGVECAEVNQTRRAKPYVTERVTMTDRDEQVEREGSTEGAKELQYAYEWHCIKSRCHCGIRIAVVKVIHTVLQVRAWFQNEDPPSKLNNTPPKGAPKAAATPAAAPLEAKSRLYLPMLCSNY